MRKVDSAHRVARAVGMLAEAVRDPKAPLRETGIRGHDYKVKAFNRASRLSDFPAIRRYLEARVRTYSPKTLQNERVALKQAFLLTHLGRYDDDRYDRAADIAFRSIKLPIPARRDLSDEILSSDEWAILTGRREPDPRRIRIPDQVRILFELLHWTGMRISELCNVRLSDCLTVQKGGESYKEVRIVGKGMRERFAMVPLDVFDAARAAFGSKEFLLQSPRDNRGLSRGASWRLVSMTTRILIGRPLSPHKLRHSLVTELIQGQVSVGAIGRMTGQSPKTILSTYDHDRLTFGRLREIVEGAG